MDKSQRNLNRCLLLTEICSVLASFLSAISVTILSVNKGITSLINNNITNVLNALNNSNVTGYISLALMIAVGILNLIIALMARLIKVYKWDTTAADYSVYIDNMDKICSTISVELSKPKNLRVDASKFIINMSESYNNLIAKSPKIEIEEQELAMSQYAKYIKERNKL
jgi:hypothetical protein